MELFLIVSPSSVFSSAIAIRETAKVGDQASRRMARGIDDLDFFIGDEALDATGYSVKVCFKSCMPSSMA